ncbi:MAG: HAD family hydrolase [Candidatus Andersenbacteria bacterium]|nr:HAD family hydrolase [bacterium]MDZ4225582.1 HAD family hydrolase [Candidatus Andersenbacteria bacterium]
MSGKGHKVFFLDRDGTINIDDGFTYKIEDWRFTERAPEALIALRDAGFKLAVITNQSGIAAGLYTAEDMKKLHEYMEEELAKSGAKLDYIAYCPHGREDICDCRKPRTGMAKQVEAALGPIDYGNSWMIGDKEADLGFGKALGMHTALITSRFWEEDKLSDRPDLIVDSLFEAVKMVLSIR